MLSAQTVTIDDIEVTANILPIMQSMSLQVRLGKDVAPVLTAFFKESTPIEFGDVIQKHVSGELLQQIIDTMMKYTLVDNKKLDEKFLQCRGTMFLWKCIFHFLKTNYEDVWNDPKIQSLISPQK